jgi:hypothetical protein
MNRSLHPSFLVFMALVVEVVAAHAQPRTRRTRQHTPAITTPVQVNTPAGAQRPLHTCAEVGTTCAHSGRGCYDPTEASDRQRVPSESEVAWATASRTCLWSDQRRNNLRVRFTGGTPELLAKVRASADMWTQHAGVRFVYVDSGPAEIRIGFAPGLGHWSHVGTCSGNTPQDQQTMNLALTAFDSDIEVQRVVLHEFGHALGLQHEHQSPLANIPWNVPAVYEYFGRTQRWSREQVDRNVLQRQDFRDVYANAFDPHSIMQYPVDGSLTTNGFSVGWNSTLSPLDIQMIGRIYPRAQHVGRIILDQGLYSPSEGWRVNGTGDFNGDGKPDLVWRRTNDTAEARIWLLDGGRVVQDVGLPANPPGWRINGVGDFNGDGKADLVWRRTDDSAEARIWLLDGAGHVAQDVGLPANPPGWRINGVGDFNGDGKVDLVWRRTDDSAEARIWLLDGGRVVQDVGLPANPPGWRINGVGDFNGDGKADLVWRRTDDSAEARIWLLDGAGHVAQDVGLPANPPGWRINGVGDFNGDGKADLVWRRTDDSAEARIWLLNGTTLMGDTGLPHAAPGWRIIGVADTNGDRSADLIWRRVNDSGEARIHYIDGSSLH